MAPHALVSYDATPIDRDALAVAALLRDAGARLSLAYVRHCGESRADRELIADVGAEGRLRDGAERLGDPGLDRHVITHPSTAAGLGELAVAIEADVIVFGSEHRTAPGRVNCPAGALALMQNGPAAVAVAPAGFATGDRADRDLGRIGILRGCADEAAVETACTLAECHGATVIDGAGDLLVVGSRPEAAPGRVLVSARAAAAIEQARTPVLVTARGVPLQFQTLVTV